MDKRCKPKPCVDPHRASDRCRYYFAAGGMSSVKPDRTTRS
jgi:hypothetical protein